ncbi:hypothetical protein ES332_D10G150100v1 [Gossypium tomentosum]|uniref:Uncharacterized protein n=1 Tax=Gossypium tomentosum TaxID=34277 RepID=A0A5D2J6F0_GOSTO|nr:hypothetical protein ES332_D10G150100v1 [Gossypium tomentosum]
MKFAGVLTAALPLSATPSRTETKQAQNPLVGIAGNLEFDVPFEVHLGTEPNLGHTIHDPI